MSDLDIPEHDEFSEVMWHLSPLYKRIDTIAYKFVSGKMWIGVRYRGKYGDKRCLRFTNKAYELFLDAGLSHQPYMYQENNFKSYTLVVSPFKL